MIRILSGAALIAVVTAGIFLGNYGVYALVVLLGGFAVIASDAAALLVGSRIGRHQFFASISPKKTVEGAIAGVVAAVIVMFVGVTVVLGISPLHAIALGVLVGTTATMGDLVESQM